ncbi:heavy-metal-associated domain-containing protein [Leucobacter sp. USHLN153]|uniref:heavy-metal-associated domain-containing protein n=1 Tax=Leucobacter sp. USHLN153 TaxID=3081268 RepID=UPI00301A4D08
MSISEFTVTGMTCEHCERAVRSEVTAIPGVIDVAVSAESGQLRVTTEGEAVDAAAVLAAVDEAGYTAQPA